MSAIVNDILLIKLFLCCAYVMLFVDALTGHPNVFNGYYWNKQWIHPALDELLWPVGICIIHILAVRRFLLDDKKIPLSDIQMKIFRLFYRRLRMPQLESTQLIFSGRVKHYKAGEVITTCTALPQSTYLVLSGIVSHREQILSLSQNTMDTEKSSDFPNLHSKGHLDEDGSSYSYPGEMFNLSAWSAFGANFYTAKVAGAIAEVDTDVIEWEPDSLKTLARTGSVALSNYVFAFLAQNLIHRSSLHRERVIEDISLPFSEEEMKSLRMPHQRSLCSFVRWIKHNLFCIPRTGLRHGLIPIDKNTSTAGKGNKFSELENLPI